jgi:hypothetical protein
MRMSRKSTSSRLSTATGENLKTQGASAGTSALEKKWQQRQTFTRNQLIMASFIGLGTLAAVLLMCFWHPGESHKSIVTPGGWETTGSDGSIIKMLIAR